MRSYLKMLIGSAAVLAASAALGQQPQQQPPGADQIQDLSIQLALTQQQLGDANKNFIIERSSTIRLGRQLNEAMAESSKKDGQIKDLEAKVAAAEKLAKETKAPAPPPENVPLSHPSNPAPSIPATDAPK